jgi:hypothetical protein
MIKALLVGLLFGIAVVMGVGYGSLIGVTSAVILVLVLGCTYSITQTVVMRHNNSIAFRVSQEEKRSR